MRTLFFSSGCMILGLLSPLAGTSSPAATGQGEGFDLRLNITVDEPLAVHMEVRAEGTATIEVNGEVIEHEIDSEKEIEFVDTYSLLEDDRWRARRDFVKWFETENGEVKDTELNGVGMDFSLENGSYEVELDDRRIRQSLLNGQLEQSELVGMWFQLPEDAQLFEEFTIEPTSLMSLLIESTTEPVSAEGKLTLVGVDEDAVAHLTGTLSAVEERNDVVMSYTGECVMLVDIPGGRLVELVWEGASTLSGEDRGADVSGEASFELSLETWIGSKAERIRDKKPVHRDVPRQPRNEEITIVLPSHWFLLDEEEGTRYQTSLHGADDPVTIECRVFPVALDQHEEEMEAALGLIEEEVGEADFGKVSCDLGKGRSMRFENDDYEFLIEFYPLSRRELLRMRLFGPPDAFREEYKNWKGFRRSLEAR